MRALSTCQAAVSPSTVERRRIVASSRPRRRNGAPAGRMARLPSGMVLAIRKEVLEHAARQVRKVTVSLAHGGIGTTLYWAVWSYLRPHTFHVLVRSLARGGVEDRWRPDAACEVWDARRLAAWRAGRTGLPSQFFQDLVDGVRHCAVVRVDGDVAGLIWIYRAAHPSRFFTLGPRDAELNHGFVLERYRGHHRFRDVIRCACRWLAAVGVERVYAVTHSTNLPSRRAFCGAGFEVMGHVRHFLIFRPKVHVDRPAQADARA